MWTAYSRPAKQSASFACVSETQQQNTCKGGDLGGTGGDAPSKFEVEGMQVHIFPSIISQIATSLHCDPVCKDFSTSLAQSPQFVTHASTNS